MEEVKPKTLLDFRKTRKWCEDMGTAGGKAGESGFIYAGCMNIEQYQGVWYLRIENFERFMAELARLEAMLYAWALTTGYIDIDSKSDEFAFIQALQKAMTPDQFAAAIERNVDEMDRNVDHMHDFADANQCMLDALGITDLDDASEKRSADAWEKAKPYLGRWK